MMEFSDWEAFQPHSFHHLYNNKLFNPNVSNKEAMLAMKHTTMSANDNYQKRNNASYTGHLKELRFQPSCIKNEELSTAESLQIQKIKYINLQQLSPLSYKSCDFPSN